ncbi:X-linked retinitis pigmentosa GTPase regulator-like [Amphibalanus amphitrite]|uniref:X-linked retinitis pigmentosa GTPase regulator-like n=1 Tax=Amphibalanus amphitrite TaxID=1232801 RepID=UPI001C926CC0|nr:X-linked retinitis pigmentosa GTPase regulator-like [Amphibalanus amphitrite]
MSTLSLSPRTTASHRVFSFGSNEFGQLGLGHTKSVTRPSCVKALKSELCSAVGCGKSHTVIGTEDGKLFAFGLNQDGQLGLGHTEMTFDQVTQWNGGTAEQIDAGVAHTVVLTDHGQLFAWGSNEDGQCGLGDAPGACLPTPVPSDEEIVSLSCGYRHTAFVTGYR